MRMVLKPLRNISIRSKMADGRITVLFVIPNLQGGGAERVFVHLMRHLDRTAFEPVLAIGALEGPLVGEIPEDVDIHELRAPRARAAVLPLIRTARLVEPDIVFSTLGLGIAAALARPFLPRKAAVVTRLGNSISAYLADVAREGQIKKIAYSLATSIMVAKLWSWLCPLPTFPGLIRYLSRALAHSGNLPSRT